MYVSVLFPVVHWSSKCNENLSHHHNQFGPSVTYNQGDSLCFISFAIKATPEWVVKYSFVSVSCPISSDACLSRPNRKGTLVIKEENVMKNKHNFQLSCAHNQPTACKCKRRTSIRDFSIDLASIIPMCQYLRINDDMGQCFEFTQSWTF